MWQERADQAPFPATPQFGFPRDDLSHYLVCKGLWDTVQRAISPLFVPQSLPEKLCLRHQVRHCAYCITVAYTTYHSIKMGSLASVHQAIDSDDWSEVMEIAFKAALSAAKEFKICSGLHPPHDEEFFSMLRFPDFEDLI